MKKSVYKNSFRNVLMALLCGAIFCTACKEDGPESVPSGVTGDCRWALTGTPGDYILTISGNGAMESYYDVPPWNQYRADIKNAVIQDGVITVGDGAFSHCSSMTSVTIGNSVETVGINAFCYCSSLTSVTIPNSVKTISDGAFAYCVGLTSVIIPNSVEIIGAGAFAYCVGMTSVTIGSSVETILPYAFAHCSNLITVVNLNPTPQNIDFDARYDNVFSGVNIATVTLKVPAGAVDDYKAAPVWGAFKNIEAISEEDE
ncbi:MAG: leucine-rich repeat domain-containing protein [Bacteroidales bacterium]|jgi:hypothetical protein|nr:leucine-rich repeat domain-containing protein [Bacteroidales bacterium]